MTILKNILVGTFLSILVFLSISFLTIIDHTGLLLYFINGETDNFDIGFPFKYFRQFWLRGNDFPITVWTGKHLIYDGVLTWVIVTGLFLFTQKLTTVRNKSS